MKPKLLSSVMAALLWLIGAYELTIIAIRYVQGRIGETIVGSLLSGASPEDRIAPTVILVVFGWLLIDILFHAVRVRSEGNALLTITGWATSSLRRVAPALRAGRRAHLALAHLGRTPARLHDLFPAESNLDAGAVENAYTLTKTLVWVLPVLGFIGTAWGMAHAIGGFSEALRETSDVQTLTARLAQKVIPGLASAFATTILALATATITHYCTSAVQAWDHEVLRRLDVTCLDLLGNIAPAVPAGQGEYGNTSDFIDVLSNLVDRLDALAQELSIGGAADALRDAGHAMKSAAETLEEAASALHNEAKRPYHITVTRG